MSCDHNYPYPQVFLVNGGEGQHYPAQLPSLVPCWSFPPAQEKVKVSRKNHGCMGVSPGLATVVLLLFLLVFAALGFGTYLIYNMQKELSEMQKVKPVQEFSKAEKYIGEDVSQRTAAHLIGKIQKEALHKTLRWEPAVGRAFTAGGVAYRTEDGALQVNETGLYHIYSRVEMIFKHCYLTSSFIHSVFVRRAGHSSPLILMEAHRAGFCSQQKGHAWTAESYLGSALQLQKYDKVLVNVSQPIYLSHASYGNFFGLYKL